MHGYSVKGDTKYIYAMKLVSPKLLEHVVQVDIVR